MDYTEAYSGGGGAGGYGDLALLLLGLVKSMVFRSFFRYLRKGIENLQITCFQEYRKPRKKLNVPLDFEILSGI